MPVSLLIAPMAAGKSHAVAIQAGGAEHHLVDGDVIIADGRGWPAQDRWWATLNQEHLRKVFLNQARLLHAFSAANRWATICYNAVGVFPLIAARWSGSIAVWLPDEAENLARAETRARAGGGGKPASTQVAQAITDVRASRTLISHLADTYNLKAGTVITEALRLARPLPSDVGGTNDADYDTEPQGGEV
jgi:hypothetical protein